MGVIQKNPIFRTFFSWISPNVLVYRLLALGTMVMALWHIDENPTGLSILVALCLLFLLAIPFQSIVVTENKIKVANYYALGIIPKVFTAKISNIRYFGYKGYEEEYLADNDSELSKYFSIENKYPRVEVILLSGKTFTRNMSSIIESELIQAILAVHKLKSKKSQ